MNKQEIENIATQIETLSNMLTLHGLSDRQMIAIHAGISALEQQLNGGWIPVSERLPEKGGWYLVTTEEMKVDLAHWFFGEGWKRGHNSNSKVIAWQPIPGPYKEDKDAERN